jgi:uncharacterized protein YkwD
MCLAAVGCEDQSLPLASGVFGKSTIIGRPNAGTCLDPPNRNQFTTQMISAINQERSRRQIPPLKQNADLTNLADFYACRLIEGGFFSHKDPYDGSTVDSRAADFGYAFWKIGENLAEGQQTVEEAIAELMLSPAHRANLLDPSFTEVGVSVKLGGDMGIYWVQEFGRPVSETPEFPTSPSSATDSPSSKPASSAPDS